MLFENFFCSDSGCAINPNKVNDLTCDCPNCEDEEELSCGFCQCPSDCGQTDPPVPQCGYRCEYSGCLINIDWVGDEFCDCPFNCEEEAEQGFICGPPSCPCPQQCRVDFPQCDPVPLSELFLCFNSGDCGIFKNKVNDLRCDCPNCEDEADAGLDCAQCDCPAFCGQTPEVPVCKFACPSSGCLIDPALVGDGSCNCPDCEDEAAQGFVCDTKPGGFCKCPTGCGPQQVFPCIAPAPPTPPPPPPSGSPFACGGGCEVTQSDVDDDYCDCPDCRDETLHTCDDCTCPTECGALKATPCFLLFYLSCFNFPWYFFPFPMPDILWTDIVNIFQRTSSL